MTSYTEITTKIADQWVAAFKGTEEALMKWAQDAQKAASALEIPSFPVPDQIAALNAALTKQLPKPNEIIEANFDLASRLLTAQRDLALRLLEVGDKATTDAAPAAKKAAAATKA